MPRLKPGSAPVQDFPNHRKEVEQRAREAVAPFSPQHKGGWPFPIEQADDHEANQRANKTRPGG